MSDSLKKMNDEDLYTWLCKSYQEEPQYIMGTGENIGLKLADCYGEHAKELKKRWKNHFRNCGEEFKKKWEKDNPKTC